MNDVPEAQVMIDEQPLKDAIGPEPFTLVQRSYDGCLDLCCSAMYKTCCCVRKFTIKKDALKGDSADYKDAANWDNAEDLAKAKEKSSMLMRYCCLPCYGYDLDVTSTGSGLARFQKPFSFLYCCPKVNVIGSNGQVITKASTDCFCSIPCLLCCAGRVRVEDESGQTQFFVHDDCGLEQPNCCCRTKEYRITGPDLAGKETIGKITNQYLCRPQECCAPPQNYRIEYPENLSADEKLGLLAATFVNASMRF